MKLITKPCKHLFVFCCFLFSLHSLCAQGLFPVSMDEKIAHSPLIVEGKVTEQHSFWNDAHTMIYTANKIELYKVFKGNTPAQNTIEIVTQGGTVGTEQIEASDLLALNINNVATFFCFPNELKVRSPLSGALLFDVYGSAQGALKYNLSTQTAIAPFSKYANVQTDLYKELSKKIGRSFTNLKPSFSLNASARVSDIQAVTITSFSPTSVHAGALLDPATNLLTINGSGFGNSPSGSAGVLFDDPDDGPNGTPYTVAYNDPLVASWTDTQIKIRVPTNAGTGSFQVMDNAGNLSAASSTLEVVYSVMEKPFTISSVKYAKEINLMNLNSAGGYTIKYSTNTANSGTDINSDPAKATFQRALTTWKEVVGFNVAEGGTTSTQIAANDAENVIMYDNTAGTPLPNGVLAVCYSYFSMCTSDPVNYQAVKTGFDVVIRKAGVSTGTVAFTIGPCPPNSSNNLAYDLETVLLHELGHAIGLGHIIDGVQNNVFGKLNPGKLMNYSVANSVKRVSPDYAAYAGALYLINPQGNSYGACFPAGEMIPPTKITESKDDCPLSFPSTGLAPGTTVGFDLVHATSNRFVDPAYTQIRCDGNGAAETNNAYYAFKTNNTGGILSLTVSGYTTTPSALTACTAMYPDVPVTGIRLALYQASSCPAAGSFPAPIGCQNFTGNGALTDISGLAANTNYLLYLDGIENTKANFSLTFSGTALPLRLTSFSGTQFDHYNRLTWTSEQISDAKYIVVQRSQDGINFEQIAQIPSSAITPTSNLNDNNPYAKENYYRLVIVNADGNKDYSSVVLLKRKDNLSVAVYPVPASNTINVRMVGAATGIYYLSLSNPLGQKLQQITTLLPEGGKTINITSSQLTSGLYFLSITDQKGKNVYNTPVVISR